MGQDELRAWAEINLNLDTGRFERAQTQIKNLDRLIEREQTRLHEESGTPFETLQKGVAVERSGSKWANSPDAEETMRHNYLMMIREWEKTGRKTFYPTVEMCTAFSQVTLDIPCRDYAQPYPFMCVSFPREISAKLHGAQKAFVHVGAALNDNDTTMSQHGLIFGCDIDRGRLMFGEALDLFPDQSVEDRLFGYEKSDMIRQMESEVRQIIRIVVNTCLAATHYKTRVVLPEAPSHWPRKKRREWEAAEPQRVEFIDQSIVWYDRQEAPAGEPGDGHHARPKPHWRRGHWRRQAHGAARAERKLIFIKPILINAAFFSGDHSQDFTEYVAK